MSANTYCNPRLYIEDIGIIENISGGLSQSGNNRLASLDINILTNRLSESALMHKKVRFYLNNGGWDTVPMFIGYIKEVSSNDTSVNIKALDCRFVLTGNNTKLITLDDVDNYDGYSLGAFLKSYIDEFVNINEVVINTEKMNDTDPPVCLIDYRTDGPVTPYSIVLKSLKDASDDTDTFNVLDYQLVMENTPTESYLRFKKEMPLNSKASFVLSHGDGIKSYSYKKRPLPNTVELAGIKVKYGGEKHTVRTDKINLYEKQIEGKTTSPALIANQAIKGLIKAREERYDITINATKGHYLQLGQLIYLNVEEEIKGNQRLLSKKIKFDKSGLSLTLTLNADKYNNY
jgi:hypothetical protein